MKLSWLTWNNPGCEAKLELEHVDEIRDVLDLVFRRKVLVAPPIEEPKSPEPSAPPERRARARPKRRPREPARKPSITRIQPAHEARGGQVHFATRKICSACHREIPTPVAWAIHNTRHKKEGLGTARLVEAKSTPRGSAESSSPGAGRTD